MSEEANPPRAVYARDFADALKRQHAQTLQLAYTTLRDEGFKGGTRWGGMPDNPLSDWESLKFYYEEMVPFVFESASASLRAQLAAAAIHLIFYLKVRMRSSRPWSHDIEAILLTAHQVGDLDRTLRGAEPNRPLLEIIKREALARREGGQKRWAGKKPAWHTLGLKLAVEMRAADPRKETVAIAAAIAVEHQALELPKATSIEKQLKRWEDEGALAKRV